MDRTAVDPLIGRVLDGRYLVGERIARGGMATVYQATDLRLDRLCALKVMHDGLGDDDDFAGRFKREARAAARLSHPHVVGVFDQGDDDGTLFLAMELVPGRTLRDLVRHEAPLPPSRALALLDPVLSALVAAHQAGIVHRDIKPENVLLGDDGTVKVADFGLARAVSAETQYTAAGGVLIGTVSYLAPELVAHGQADARTDVYAVGVVLFELLTGAKPHQGQSPIEVAYKHVHEDVPPPSTLVAGLPSYVDALVARATARDPDRRPADARVLQIQARRVRSAVDQGVLDDEELTSDLSPTVAVPLQRSEPPREEPDLPPIEEVRAEFKDAPTLLTPAQLAAGARRGDHTDDTSIVAAPPRSTRRPTGRRSRRGPLLLLLALLLVTGGGAAAWWFGDGRYTKTPPVVGRSSAAAETRIEAEGLAFRGTRAYSEQTPANVVLRTDPAGGERVRRHGTVDVVVSRGPERHAVPNLAGRRLSQARGDLGAAHLSLGDVARTWSEKVATGIVLSSTPASGVPLKRDAAIDVVVSRGPRPIKVPDLTGEDADDAEKALGKLDLRVDRDEVNSDTVDEGDVVRQRPHRGTLFRGDRVRLVVSKGPVLVTVPNVVARNVSGATATLEAAGFDVQTVRVDVWVGLNVVVRQSPGSGNRAPRGSTVTLSVV